MSQQIVKEKDELKRYKTIGMPEPWNSQKAIQHEWLSVEEARKNPVTELSISCIMARVPFGYEYIGNRQRLVITPLTDRCFRAIFMAIHYSYGASVEGPVGTGKTETTKEIAKSVGKMCFVFNCSSSLNFESLLKFFKGFVSGGSWSCFDEFNRIESEVLSIISQTIMTINQALREQRKEIILGDDDKPMPFNDSCAIFITMNPPVLQTNLLGGNKKRLPDNLYNQFRPV